MKQGQGSANREQRAEMASVVEVEGVKSAAAVRPRARRAVLAMPEYHPPLAGRNALRLDFNENTFAASPRVMERLRQVTAEGLTKYPEREAVERIVAKHFGLRGGAGAADQWCGRGDSPGVRGVSGRGR